MLCKEQNIMQGNTMVIDSISKDFSSHMYWLVEKKNKKKTRGFLFYPVLSFVKIDLTQQE